MTSQIVKEKLRTLLTMFANHPAMFAGREIHAEAYLMGLMKGVCLSSEIDESYRKFLVESGFQEHTFLSRFETKHNCRSTLISDGSEVDESVNQALQTELSSHVLSFIAWLDRQQ